MDWWKALGATLGAIASITGILVAMGQLPWATKVDMEKQRFHIERHVVIRMQGVNENLSQLLINQGEMREENNTMIVKIAKIEANMENAREDLREIKEEVSRYKYGKYND